MLSHCAHSDAGKFDIKIILVFATQCAPHYWKLKVRRYIRSEKHLRIITQETRVTEIGFTKLGS